MSYWQAIVIAQFVYCNQVMHDLLAELADARLINLPGSFDRLRIKNGTVTAMAIPMTNTAAITSNIHILLCFVY